MSATEKFTHISLQTSMWTYPWDVLDLGAETVIREITGRAGLGGISLATVYHAGRFLQPRSPRRKVYFPEDGTVYFQVSPSAYDALRVKPQVASLLSEGDVLRLLERRSREDGFRLSAWIVGLHNTRIGSAYPDVTTQNAFGDRYLYSLCPNNPETRHYLTTLLHDLTYHYELDAIELESFNYMGYNHEFHHEKDGVGMTSRDQFLMSLCFCDYCRAQAMKNGIAMDVAVQTVRRWLEESFTRPVSEPDEEFIKQGLAGFRDTPAVYEYLKWRLNAVTSLVAEVREVVHPRTQVYFLSLFTPGTSWLFGVDFAAVAEKTDGIVVCCYDTPASQVEEDMRVSVAQLGLNSGKKLLTGLRVFYPEVHSGEELAAKVEGAVRGGSGGFLFYNYGLIPAARLDWVYRSLRR